MELRICSLLGFTSIPLFVLSRRTGNKLAIQLDIGDDTTVLLCQMIPVAQSDGLLPPGIHRASWEEFGAHFGSNAHRRLLLEGMQRAGRLLRLAGCVVLFVDGSYVSTMEVREDFDGGWCLEGVDLVLLKRLEPVFFDFGFSRAAQKAKFFGEFFPAEMQEGMSGKPFLSFFQVDKETGNSKGIVSVDLRSLHD